MYTSGCGRKWTELYFSSMNTVQFTPSPICKSFTDVYKCMSEKRDKMHRRKISLHDTKRGIFYCFSASVVRWQKIARVLFSFSLHQCNVYVTLTCALSITCETPNVLWTYFLWKPIDFFFQCWFYTYYKYLSFSRVWESKCNVNLFIDSLCASDTNVEY